MLKGSDIIGKPIITYDTGKQIEKVTDLIFDHNTNYILAFLVSDSGWFNAAKVIPIEEVHAIGTDAVIVKWKFAVVAAKKIREVKKILNCNHVLKDTRVMTTDGRFLGTMIDLYFDERNGQIEGYEVDGGMFAHPETGRSFVPAPQTIRIGVDVAFVPPETVDLMSEQIVEIKDENSALWERALPQSSTPGEIELAATELLPRSNIDSVELLPPTQEASTVLQPNTVLQQDVDPNQQKAFVIGKNVDRTVITPDGTPLVMQGQLVTLKDVEAAMRWGILHQLYVAAGGQSYQPTIIQNDLPLTANSQVSEFTQINNKQFFERQEKSQKQAQASVNSSNIEQAKGRRLQRSIQTQEGFFIGAQGQIVTNKIIELSKNYHKEQELIAAVGLKTAKGSHFSTKLTRTDKQLHTFVDSGDETSVDSLMPTYSEKNAFWGQLKAMVNGFQKRNSQATEEQRIKIALGRPVNRVILDSDDNFILNVGELVTHQAIDYAQEAGVLDILLASVEYHPAGLQGRSREPVASVVENNTLG
ncbi:MAG: PRC-barrel domain-containing protein [Crinalium sp.]